MKILCLRLGLLVAATCALATVSPAQTSFDKPKSEIEIRVGVSVPSGEANFSGTTNSGSTIDFGRDFDFKNEFGYELRYTYRTTDGKHKFLVDYDSTDWERTTILSRSFTFRGETFVANATLDGSLDLRTFRAMYSYRWGNERLRIGPMFDLGVVQTDLEITGTTASGTRTADGKINKFAATVGYDLDYEATPKVSIFHNLGGIAFKKERFFHTEGGVKVFFTKSFGAVGGYKFQWYKLDGDDPNFLKIQKHGPFFGGVIRF